MAKSSNQALAEANTRVIYEIRKGLSVDAAVKKVSQVMKLTTGRTMQLANSVNYRRSALEALQGAGFGKPQKPAKQKKPLLKRILRR